MRKTGDKIRPMQGLKNRSLGGTFSTNVENIGDPGGSTISPRVAPPARYPVYNPTVYACLTAAPSLFLTPPVCLNPYSRIHLVLVLRAGIPIQPTLKLDRPFPYNQDDQPPKRVSKKKQDTGIVIARQKTQPAQRAASMAEPFSSAPASQAVSGLVREFDISMLTDRDQVLYSKFVSMMCLMGIHTSKSCPLLCIWRFTYWCLRFWEPWSTLLPSMLSGNDHIRSLLEQAYRDTMEKKLLSGYTGIFPALDTEVEEQDLDEADGAED
eukprot:gene9206-1654_t